jgi:hypothetical protein
MAELRIIERSASAGVFGPASKTRAKLRALVRGRTIDPRGGKMRETNWALPNLSKVRDALES